MTGLSRRHLTAFIMLLGAATLTILGCGAMDSESNTGKTSGEATISVVGSGIVEVGDTVTLKAEVKRTNYLPDSYHWSPTDPSNLPISFNKVDSSGKSISFTVTTAGTHSVSCRVKLAGSGESLYDTIHLQVTDPKVATLKYTARVIPPASSELPPSEQSVKVGAVDQTNLTWTVANGTLVTLTVRDGVTKAPLPSYVRLSTAGDDPLPRDIYLGTGSSKVRVSGTFHAMFIPVPVKAATDPAPMLKAYVKESDLSSKWEVSVDQGVAVSGTIKDSTGAAMVGARVSMLSRHAVGEDVPSTVATTDSAGAYTARTRSGTVSVTVIPPTGSTLPPALISSEKLALKVVGASTGWDFQYKQVDLVKLTGVVQHSDGSTPADGAQVRFKLISSKASVGDLKVSAASSFSGVPLVQQTLVADKAGALAGSAGVSLPRGKYKVEIWPGTSAPKSEGYVTQDLDLTGTAATKQLTLKLARRATVSGVIASDKGKALQARITARGSGGSFQAVSGVDGKFSLQLDDGLDYRLVARALGRGVHAGPLVKASVKISGDHNLGTLTLPKAVVISGQVKTSGQAGLGGARVRVWCSDTACASKDVVDETTTLSDGSFELRLPVTK